RLAKVSLGATIPVTQYGNLQPLIEAEGETYEEAMEIALRRIHDLWNRTAERPLSIDRDAAQAGGKILTCWASGPTVAFDPTGHTYRVGNGPKWLGGSTFASRYVQEFPGPLIASKMADKHGVEAQDVLDMWDLNA